MNITSPSQLDDYQFILYKMSFNEEHRKRMRDENYEKSYNKLMTSYKRICHICCN